MKTPRFFLLLPTLALLAGCGSLQKNIDVPLPSYDSQLAVEAYLIPGEVPRIAVSESVAYLDPNNVLPTVPKDATVALTLPDGRVEVLKFAPGADSTERVYFTHVGTEPLLAQPGDVFRLDIIDKRGRHLSGTATMPSTVPLDSIRYKFNDRPDTLRRALCLAYFQDPATPDDDYRLQMHIGDPARGSVYKKPKVDYSPQDRLLNGQRFVLGTGFVFHPQDTVTVTLYHLDPAHYRFRQSVSNARNANGNPFAQPSAIYSTVQGGIGVFTVLNYTRMTQILRP